MPLLPKEPELFPDDIFRLPADAFPWLVAHVRSRQEKVLARHLLQRQIPFYLPQTERLVERSGRRLRSYLPLFGGYVFFRGGAMARDAAIRSGVAARIIDVEDQALLGGELEQIRRLQISGATFEVYEQLVPNDVVKIVEGAFRGYTGAVVRSSRGDRLIVSVSLLRKSVAVEFERPVLRRAKQ